MGENQENATMQNLCKRQHSADGHFTKVNLSNQAWSGLGQIQIHTFVFVPKCKFASIRLSLRQSLRIQIDLNFPTHLLYLFLTSKEKPIEIKHM